MADHLNWTNSAAVDKTIGIALAMKDSEASHKKDSPELSSKHQLHRPFLYKPSTQTLLRPLIDASRTPKKLRETSTRKLPSITMVTSNPTLGMSNNHA